MDHNSIPSGSGILNYFNQSICSEEFREQLSENSSNILSTIVKDNGISDLSEKIKEEIINKYSDYPRLVQQILFLTKYIAEDAVISDYMFMSKDRLMMFLLINGQNWRSLLY